MVPTNINIQGNSKLVEFIKSLLIWQNKYSLSDSCLLALIYSIKVFLTSLNIIVGSEFLNHFIEELPDTMYSARKLVDLDRDDFEQYVVCCDCYSIYDRKDAVIRTAIGMV